MCVAQCSDARAAVLLSRFSRSLTVSSRAVPLAAASGCNAATRLQCAARRLTGGTTTLLHTWRSMLFVLHQVLWSCYIQATVGVQPIWSLFVSRGVKPNVWPCCTHHSLSPVRPPGNMHGKTLFFSPCFEALSVSWRPRRDKPITPRRCGPMCRAARARRGERLNAPPCIRCQA